MKLLIKKLLPIKLATFGGHCKSVKDMLLSKGSKLENSSEASNKLNISYLFINYLQIV